MKKQILYALLICISGLFASCGNTANIIEFNNHESIKEQLARQTDFFNAQLTLQEGITLGEPNGPSTVKISFINAKTTNGFTPEMFDSANKELSKMMCTNLIDKERYKKVEVKYEFEKGVKLNLGDHLIDVTRLKFEYSCDTL